MRTVALRVLALVAASLLGACSDGRGAPRVVLLVDVDTLRADALGCYGNRERGEEGALPSPNVDQLASESVLFERAYSSAPWTIPSLTTQLTGEWPWDHRALRILEPLAPELPTLAERFREAGWRTAGVSANFVVRSAYGFDQGFERWDETHATGHTGSSGHDTVDVLLEFADELAERPGEGIFLFLLLFEPHYRYEDQPGVRFGPGWSDSEPYEGRLSGGEALDKLRKIRHGLDETDVRFLRGRYQGEVARTDEAVGALLLGLRERGMMEETLVVLTSDHGEEIMDRGWIGHTRTLFDELVRVPLIVRLPGGERGGVRIDDAVSQVDLGATLLDLAGVGKGLGEGVSFAETIRAGTAPSRRYLYLHTDFEAVMTQDTSQEKRALKWGVVDGKTRLKWVVDHLVEGDPIGSLYDLEADPGEAVDLAPKGDVPANLKRLAALDPARREESATPLPVPDEGTR